jgi:Ca2+-binding RTX toxin-like protein
MSFDMAIEGFPDVNDYLEGTSSGEVLRGHSGNDTLIGLGGNDTFFGGKGDDEIHWNAGNDAIDGGDGPMDWLLLQFAPHGFVVDLKAQTVLQVGGGEIDAVAGIELVRGSNFADTLLGSDGDDFFFPDYTLASAFPNAAIGGADFINGRGGFDVLSYGQEGGKVVIDVAAGTARDGTGNIDTFKNMEQYEGSKFADKITGSGEAEVIWGLAGGDTIRGGGGNDTIVGHLGKDNYSGGTGKDVFEFWTTKGASESKANRDVITDFKPGTDKIDLSSIDAIAGTTKNDKFKFDAEATAFDGTKGRLITVLNIPADYIIVQGDLNGDEKADFWIELNGDHTVTAGDFIL